MDFPITISFCWYWEPDYFYLSFQYNYYWIDCIKQLHNLKGNRITKPEVLVFSSQCDALQLNSWEALHGLLWSGTAWRPCKADILLSLREINVFQMGRSKVDLCPVWNPSCVSFHQACQKVQIHMNQEINNL